MLLGSIYYFALLVRCECVHDEGALKPCCGPHYTTKSHSLFLRPVMSYFIPVYEFLWDMLCLSFERFNFNGMY